MTSLSDQRYLAALVGSRAPLLVRDKSEVPALCSNTFFVSQLGIKTLREPGKES